MKTFYEWYNDQDHRRGMFDFKPYIEYTKYREDYNDVSKSVKSGFTSNPCSTISLDENQKCSLGVEPKVPNFYVPRGTKVIEHETYTETTIYRNEYKAKIIKCECGSEFTSNPSHHSDWCPKC